MEDDGVMWEWTQGFRHHSRRVCDGLPCPFHGPSLHPMIEEPMVLRWENWAPVVDRVCRHGFGHPDPDSVAWLHRSGLDVAACVDCDGCCRLPGAARLTDDP